MAAARQSTDRALTSRFGTLRNLYLRLVDSGIPAVMRQGDPNMLRRARLIIGFTLVLLLLGLETAVFFTWALPGYASLRVNAALAVALGLTLAIPSVFRRTGSLELGANLVIAGSAIVIVSTIFVSGGIDSDLLHWVGVLPMLAALMGARRSAWCWAFFGILTVGLLVYADGAGSYFSNALDLAQHSSTLLIQRCVDVSSWLGILLAIALLYEGHTEQQTAELAVKNADLESEIVQRTRAEERTLYLAHYDELTELPNRRFFRQQLAEAVERAKRNSREVAILYLDLDGFKEVNDTHGHSRGDELLREVAKRLRHCVRLIDSVARGTEGIEDSVSRLGGDEFTILLDGLRSHFEAAIVAKRVLDSLSSPIRLGHQEVFISASIGIAIHAGTDDMDEILQNADRAMYYAKEKGKNNFQFFDPSMNSDIVKRSQTSTDLRGALDDGQFVLHFQPIVETAGHSITAMESLIRWQHPERGLLPPSEFIEVAENTGLIVRLGEWVITESCRSFARWREIGVAPARVSVNVSSVQFRTGALARTVSDTLRKVDLSPQCLELEITENAMMLDEEEASRCLADLKSLGVRIALDDFGTGYSSLSYVKRFPVDALKIDRSFVAGLESDPEAQAISTAIIAMAHQLGLSVVAEGVETVAQERFLEDRGCDELQGFRFSRPVDAPATERLLLAGVIEGEDL